MKVLVMGEFSGRVRDEFRSRGHQAVPGHRQGHGATMGIARE